MNKYHKIQTVLLRDPFTKFRTLLEGQYALSEFEFLKDCIWDWYEKIDGMNMRAIWNPEGDSGAGLITFKGKTDRAQIPLDLLQKMTSIFNSKIKELGIIFTSPVCFYGEGYGAGIQKGGGNYTKYKDFVCFDIKIGDHWLERKNVEHICNRLGIDIAPVVGRGTLVEMQEFVKKGFDSCWGPFPAEGVIARPGMEFKTRRGDRIITKLKCKDYNPALNQ